MRGFKPQPGIETVRRVLLSLAVYLCFLIIIVLPLGALLAEGIRSGLSVLGRELLRPEAVFALRMTLLITLFTVMINTGAGIVMAYSAVRGKLPGRGLISALAELPMAVSPVIAGLVLVILYGPHTMIGLFFERLDWKVMFALPGMILATLFVTLPYVVKELIPVMQKLGTEQEEAAYTLGAGRVTAFIKVTLPALKWSIIYGALMTTARSLGEFGAVLVVSGNIIMQTETATLYIYQSMADFNLAGAYAVSLVLVAFSIIALVLLQLLDRGREEASI